jgi:phosphate/sulfate permease
LSSPGVVAFLTIVPLFPTIVDKAGNNLEALKGFSPGICAAIAAATGVAAGLAWVFLFGPCVLKRMEREREEKANAELEAAVGIKDPDAEKGTMHTVPDDVDEIKSLKQSIRELQQHTGLMEEEEIREEQAKEQAVADATPVIKKTIVTQPESEPEEPKGALAKFGANTFNQDLEKQSWAENARAAEIWDAAEEYDPDAERLFNFIQVFTACLNSFGHGANDVANAIAPLSAIVQIYQTGEVEAKTGVQKWLLAMGGLFIVFGLLLYGYKIMKSLGYKLTKLSPSRGSCAELAASLTVVTASFLAIPVSSTQCIVGAISGVGLVNGPQNVQWLFLLRVMCGWVVMFIGAVLLAMGVFSFAIFSPDLN